MSALDVAEVKLTEDSDSDVVAEFGSENNMGDSKSGLKHRNVVVPQEEEKPAEMEPERMVLGFMEKLERSPILPQAVKPYIKKLQAVVPVIGKMCKTVFPVLEAIMKYGKLAYKEYTARNLQIYLPIFIGAILVLYGGTFMFLIAAVEAYRISGWEKTAKCIRELQVNYKRVMEEDAKDDKWLDKDDDGDGRTNAEEMTDEEYLHHKVHMIMSVVEPQQVMDALTGISSGFFAVLATLKVKFAEAVTLGVCLGKMAEKGIKKLFLRELQNLAGDYKKWVDPCLTYLCRFVGISFAYTLQRVIYAFYTSVRGADIILMCVAALMSAKRKGDLVDSETNTKWLIAKLGIGLLGFFKQLVWGFGLTFPLNVLLSPALAADWFIGASIAWA